MDANRGYYVRTTEYLNVPFARDVDAWHAARLLNSMAEASERCDRQVYRLAREQYVEAFRQQGGSAIDWEGGVFKLLNPGGDLSSLAFYVMPSFRACEDHVLATKPSRRIARAGQIANRWAKH
jgi:hypothetical protein